MPVVASPAFVLSPPAGVQPLTHARIGHHSWTREDGVSASASSSASDFPAAAVLNWLTYEAWKPNSLPATLKIDLGAARTVDYCGLVHALGDAGAAVSVQYSIDDASYTEVASASPGSNQPLFFLFEEVTARYWQFVVTGGSDLPTLNVAYLGQVLEMERPIYGGHTPLLLARKTTFMPQASETGQFLGRSIIRKGYATKVQYSRLTSDFVRGDFKRFIDDARYYGYFFAWRPETFPDEVAYCQTNEDIHPTNAGKRNFMSVSWNIEAIDGSND